jgi:hypothetical protein
VEKVVRSLCPYCTNCPEIVIDDETVRIGEDANTAVLKKDEWNVLVELIRSGELGRL